MSCSKTTSYGVDSIDISSGAGTSLGASATFFEKLRNSNGWPRWLAEKLDCPFVTMAVEGRNNKEILDEIKNVVTSGVLKNDDIIIVMLTYPYRRGANPIDTFDKMEEVFHHAENIFGGMPGGWRYIVHKVEGAADKEYGR